MQGRAYFAKTNEHLNAVDQLHNTLALRCRAPRQIATRNGRTYRHALAATATRTGTDGVVYLYTLNLACPERMWSDMQPQFQKSIDSFRLVQPTSVRSQDASAWWHVQTATSAFQVT